MDTHGFPELLRRWRKDRRWSQEQLAFEAETSPRHLSCLETAKSGPSRPMVLRLARALELDLRERNLLLRAAGFDTVYHASDLDSARMKPVMRAVDLTLQKHEPYPAILVDRTWNTLKANRGAVRLLSEFMPPDAPEAAMLNMMDATFHPLGLKPSIVNWDEVAAISVAQIEQACAVHPRDAERNALLNRIRSYDGVDCLERVPAAHPEPVGVVHVQKGELNLRLFMMVTTVGTPFDVTAQEIMLETFFPADDITERWFQAP